MTERTEIERLDLVARAEAIGSSFARSGVIFSILSCFFVLLAFVSTASFYETLAIRTLAALAVVTTIALWSRSRYALYAMEILIFAILIGGLLPFEDPDDHTPLGSSARYVTIVLMFGAGYRCWTNARPFAEAHSATLEKERSIVQQWMHLLNSSENSERTVEFSAKSFWTGYWTYRLLNTGSCWLVEKFKMGKMQRMLDCRVRELGGVRVVEHPGGTLDVVVGSDSFPSVDLTPDMRDRFFRLIKPVS